MLQQGMMNEVHLNQQDPTIHNSSRLFEKLCLQQQQQHQDWSHHQEEGLSHHQNLNMDRVGMANMSSAASGLPVLDKTNHQMIPTCVASSVHSPAANNDQSVTLMNLLKLIELEEKNVVASTCTTSTMGVSVVNTGGMSPSILPTMPPKLDLTAAGMQQTNGRPITGSGKLTSSAATVPLSPLPQTLAPPPMTPTFPPPPFPPPMNLRLPPPTPSPAALAAAGGSGEQRFFPPALPVNFKVPPPTHIPAVPPPSFSVPPPGMAAVIPQTTPPASVTGGYAGSSFNNMPRSRLALELHVRLEQAYDQFR